MSYKFSPSLLAALVLPLASFASSPLPAITKTQFQNEALVFVFKGIVRQYLIFSKSIYFNQLTLNCSFSMLLNLNLPLFIFLHFYLPAFEHDGHL